MIAFVMDQIRRANINIEEVHNAVFEGAAAACCRIQLGSEVGDELLQSMRTGNSDIIDIELLNLS